MNDAAVMAQAGAALGNALAREREHQLMHIFGNDSQASPIYIERRWGERDYTLIEVTQE